MKSQKLNLTKLKIKGFTLIELLVVMVIFVFLTVIVGSVFLFSYKSLLNFKNEYENVSTVTLFYENLYDDFKSSNYIIFNNKQLVFYEDAKSCIYDFEVSPIKKNKSSTELLSESEIVFLASQIKKLEYCNGENGLVSYIELEVTSGKRKYQFSFKKKYDSKTLVNWELSNLVAE